MRTLNNEEIKAVSGGAGGMYDPDYKSLVEIGGKFIGDKSPSLFKAVVGLFVGPPLLLIYYVTFGQMG